MNGSFIRGFDTRAEADAYAAGLAPTPRPTGPAFAVNSMPVGCHQSPDAAASIAFHHTPGTVLAMDLVLQRNGETWHRELERRCWIRTTPGGPVRVFGDRAEADRYALTVRPLPGKGDSLRGQGLSVQLLDYEFRPPNHPDAAAIKYVLRFINESGANAEIFFSQADVSGVDNRSATYKDWLAVSISVINSRCLIIPAPDPKQLEQRFTVPARSTKDITLYLNRSDATDLVDGSNCRKGVKSRVASDARYVDLKLGVIKYRAAQSSELVNPIWRLMR
jgi:hypothetical protein